MRTLFTALSLAFILATAFPAFAQESVRRPRPRLLESFSAGPYDFQLMVRGYVLKGSRVEYPVSVNLLQNGKRLDSITLGENALTQDFVRRPVIEAWPKEQARMEPDAKTWTADFGQSHTAVMVRPVQLAPDLTGILVSQTWGEESVQRSHTLYVIYKGQFKATWSLAEQGSVQAIAYPITMDGRQHVLALENRRGLMGIDDSPDLRRYSLVSFEAETKAITSTPLPAKGYPLYAVSIAFFSDTQQARAAAKGLPCSGASDIWALDTLELSGFSRNGRIMLGDIFVSIQDAKSYLLGLVGCRGAENAEINVIHEKDEENSGITKTSYGSLPVFSQVHTKEDTIIALGAGMHLRYERFITMEAVRKGLPPEPKHSLNIIIYKNNNPIQELRDLEYFPADKNEELRFEIADYNMDGRPDFSFVRENRNNLIYRSVYLYDAMRDIYRFGREFSELTNMAVDSEKKLITARFYAASCDRWTNEYTVGRFDELSLTHSYGSECGPRDDNYYIVFDRYYADDELIKEHFERVPLSRRNPR